jgi:hypothetical protein
MDATDRQALDDLEFRLRAILPEEYQDSYDDIQPISMGSAGLKYDADGRVAWNEMWATFCDLAMAGGPPHKGMLLAPGLPSQVEAEPDRYRAVVDEICRGIDLVTGLAAAPSSPGWIAVECDDEGMAGWLLRAIVMENVAARARGVVLELPAAPHYRIEKEIKNVITVIAKTCHYWTGHMPPAQRRAIGEMFDEMSEDAPLIAPAASSGGEPPADEAAIAARMREIVAPATGLTQSAHTCAGWFGVDAPTVRDAIWMMRAMVVNNILARREGTTLFVPINSAVDPGGEAVARCLVRVWELSRLAAR